MSDVVEQIESRADVLDKQYYLLVTDSNPGQEVLEIIIYNTEQERKKNVAIFRDLYTFSQTTPQKKYCQTVATTLLTLLQQRKGITLYQTTSGVITWVSKILGQACNKYTNIKHTEKIEKENLDDLTHTDEPFADAMELLFTHPYLFQSNTINKLAGMDEKKRKKFKKHIKLFKQLTFTDIAQKKLDKNTLAELLDRHYHNNFNMALNTLIKLTEHSSPESLFPINADGVQSNTEQPPFGMIFELPLELIKRLHGFNHFIYLFHDIQSILHDCVGYYLLKKDLHGLEEFCTLVEQEKLTGLKRIMIDLLKREIPAIFPASLIPQVITADDMYTHKKNFDEAALAKTIQAMGQKYHFRIPQSDAEDAAEDTQISDFLVFTTSKLNDKKLDYHAGSSTTKNLFVIASPDKSYRILTPATVDIIISEKADTLLTELPRQWNGGKRFYHTHKEQFATFKKGTLSLDEKLTLLTTMHNLPEPHATDVETLLALGQPHGKHHFISRTHPNTILAKEIDTFTKELLFLGYATGNCLKWHDLFYYMLEEHAHTKLLWHNGLIVGTAFEITLNDGGYLVDSIEFTSTLNKRLHAPHQNTQQFIHGVVHAYLNALHDHEPTLYILPESNSLFVEDAIKSWLTEKNAHERLIAYSPTSQLSTDTIFKKIPYRIPPALRGYSLFRMSF